MSFNVNCDDTRRGTEWACTRSVETGIKVDQIEKRVHNIEQHIDLLASTVKANTEAVQANVESNIRLSKVIDRFDERLDIWIKRLVEHEIAEEKANASLLHKTMLLWWLIAVSMVSTVGWLLTLFSPGIAALIRTIAKIITQ